MPLTSFDYPDIVRGYLASEEFNSVPDERKPLAFESFRKTFVNENEIKEDEDLKYVNDKSAEIFTSYRHNVNIPRFTPTPEQAADLYGQININANDPVEKRVKSIEDWRDNAVPSSAKKAPSIAKDFEFHIEDLANNLIKSELAKDSYKPGGMPDFLTDSVKRFTEQAIRGIGVDLLADYKEANRFFAKNLVENPEFDNDFTSQVVGGLGNVLSQVALSAAVTAAGAPELVAPMLLTTSTARHMTEAYNRELKRTGNELIATDAAVNSIPAGILDAGPEIFLGGLLNKVKGFSGAYKAATTEAAKKAVIKKYLPSVVKGFTLGSLNEGIVGGGATHIAGNLGDYYATGDEQYLKNATNIAEIANNIAVEGTVGGLVGSGITGLTKGSNQANVSATIAQLTDAGKTVSIADTKAKELKIFDAIKAGNYDKAIEISKSNVTAKAPDKIIKGDTKPSLDPSGTPIKDKAEATLKERLGEVLPEQSKIRIANKPYTDELNKIEKDLDPVKDKDKLERLKKARGLFEKINDDGTSAGPIAFQEETEFESNDTNFILKGEDKQLQTKKPFDVTLNDDTKLKNDNVIYVKQEGMALVKNANLIKALGAPVTLQVTPNRRFVKFKGLAKRYEASVNPQVGWVPVVVTGNKIKILAPVREANEVATKEPAEAIDPSEVKPKPSLVDDSEATNISAAKNINITNINDLIKNGGGIVSVEENGRKVDFDKFAIGIDGNSAEVLFVELNQKERGKKIGKAAYIALGNNLLEKGIILQSSKAQYANGNALWKSLAKEGYATRGGQGVYTFRRQNPVVETETIDQTRIDEATEKLNKNTPEGKKVVAPKVKKPSSRKKKKAETPVEETVETPVETPAVEPIAEDTIEPMVEPEPVTPTIETIDQINETENPNETIAEIDKALVFQNELLNDETISESRRTQVNKNIAKLEADKARIQPTVKQDQPIKPIDRGVLKQIISFAEKGDLTIAKFDNWMSRGFLSEANLPQLAEMYGVSAYDGDLGKFAQSIQVAIKDKKTKAPKQTVEQAIEETIAPVQDTAPVEESEPDILDILQQEVQQFRQQTQSTLQQQRENTPENIARRKEQTDRINELAKDVGLKNLTIVNTHEELNRADVDDAVQGFVEGSQVVMILDNIIPYDGETTLEATERIFKHEVVGHLKLSRVLSGISQEGFNNLVTFLKTRKWKSGDSIWERTKAAYTTDVIPDDLEIVDEIFAKLTENKDKESISIISKIINWIRVKFLKAGIANWTTNDLDIIIQTAFDSELISDSDANVVNEDTITDSVSVVNEINNNIEEVLTTEEKSQAATELGFKKWNEEALSEFKNQISDWLVYGKAKTQALEEIFVKLVKSLKNISAAMLAAISINTGDASITEIGFDRLAQSPVFPIESTMPNVNITSGFLGNIEPEIIPVSESNQSVPLKQSSPIKIEANFNGIKAHKSVVNTANEIINKKNNEGKPFIIGDKTGGLLYVFDANGNLKHKAPSLFGEEKGDKIVGDKKITPSGRFKASVNEADSSDYPYGKTLDFLEKENGVVAIHRVYLANPEENRIDRLDSNSPKDNRVSSGCINVHDSVMDNVINPTFEKEGGFVYILPENRNEKIRFSKSHQSVYMDSVIRGYGAWIAPNGKITDVGYQDHLGKAIDIIGEEAIEGMTVTQVYAEMAKRGYLRVINGSSILVDEQYKLNSSQKAVLEFAGMNSDKNVIMGDKYLYKTPAMATRFSKSQPNNNVKDQKYLAAVESGDLYTAQKMVDEAAKEAGYNIEVYHGSRESELKTLDPKTIPPQKRTDGGRYGWDATYLSTKEEASGYGKKLYRFFAKIKNPFIVPAGEGNPFYSKLEKLIPGVTKKIIQGNNFAGEYVKRLGYDGVYEPSAKYAGSTRPIYAVYDSNQIKSADTITRDDQGNVIPLSQRFSNSPDIRFSKSQPNNNFNDQKYLAAVESGDLGAAQKMVDEAAKDAGFTETLYHGSPDKSITTFRESRNKQSTFEFHDYGEGVYLTKYEKSSDGVTGADHYTSLNERSIDALFSEEKENTGKVYKLYAKLNKPVIAENSPSESEWSSIKEYVNKNGGRNTLEVFEEIIEDTSNDDITFGELLYDEVSRIVKRALSVLGYDGVYAENGEQIVVWNNNQVKSADPVTKDDQGNVIPLSQRFSNSPDIRFSKSQPNNNFNDQKYLAAVESGDLDTAQKMVDEARKNAKYTKDLYTAQAEGFQNYNFNRVGQNERGLVPDGMAALGPGIYLLDEKDYTKNVYGKRGNIYHVGLSEDAFIIDIFSTDKNHWKEAISKLDKAAIELGYNDYRSMPDKNVSGLKDGRGPVGLFVKLIGREKARELLVKHGIHGSREELPGGQFEYAIYDPSKLKSADPITKDDQGNVIPLSQRFSNSPDIRFSKSQPSPKKQKAPVTEQTKEDNDLDWIVTDNEIITQSKSKASKEIAKLIKRTYEQKLMGKEIQINNAFKGVPYAFLNDNDVEAFLADYQDFVNTRNKQEEPATERIPVDVLEQRLIDYNKKANKNEYEFYASRVEGFPEFAFFNEDAGVARAYFKELTEEKNDDLASVVINDSDIATMDAVVDLQFQAIEAIDDISDVINRGVVDMDSSLVETGNPILDSGIPILKEQVGIMRKLFNEYALSLITTDATSLSGGDLRRVYYSLLSLVTDGYPNRLEGFISSETTDIIRNMEATFSDPYGTRKKNSDISKLESNSSQIERLATDGYSYDLLTRLQAPFREGLVLAKRYHEEVITPYIESLQRDVYNGVLDADMANKIGMFGILRQRFLVETPEQALKQSVQWILDSNKNTIGVYDRDFDAQGKRHQEYLEENFLSGINYTIEKGQITSDFTPEDVAKFYQNANIFIGDKGIQYADGIVKMYDALKPLSKFTTEFIYGRPFEEIENYIPSMSVIIKGEGDTDFDIAKAQMLTDAKSFSSGQIFYGTNTSGLGSTKSRTRKIGTNRSLVFNINYAGESLGRIAVYDYFTAHARQEMSQLLNHKNKNGKLFAKFLGDPEQKRGRTDAFRSAMNGTWQNVMSQASYMHSYHVATNWVGRKWAQGVLSGLHQLPAQLVSNTTPYFVQHINEPHKIGNYFKAATYLLKHRMGMLEPHQARLVDKVIFEVTHRQQFQEIDKSVNLDINPGSLVEMMKKEMPYLYRAVVGVDKGIENILFKAFRLSDTLSGAPMALAEYLNAEQDSKGTHVRLEDLTYDPVSYIKAIDATERYIGIGDASRRGEYLTNKDAKISIARNLLIAFRSFSINNAVNFGKEMRRLFDSNVSREQKAQSFKYMMGIAAQSVTYTMMAYAVQYGMAAAIVHALKNPEEEEELKKLYSKSQNRMTKNERRTLNAEISMREKNRKVVQNIQNRTNNTRILSIKTVKDAASNMFIPFNLEAVPNIIIHVGSDGPEAETFKAWKKGEIDRIQKLIKRNKALENRKTVTRLNEELANIQMQEFLPAVYEQRTIANIGGSFGGTVEGIVDAIESGSKFFQKPEAISPLDFVNLAAVIGVSQPDIKRYFRASSLIEKSGKEREEQLAAYEEETSP